MKAKRKPYDPLNRVLVLPRDAGLPSRSWWTETDRDGFTQRARQEQERMATSVFGRSAVHHLTLDGGKAS